MSHPAAATPHRPGALALAIERDDWERASLLILLAFSRTVRRMPPGTIDDLLALLSIEDAGREDARDAR